MKALVTGGSGYFGMLLVNELRARGHDVRILDLNDAEDRPTEVELVRGDIRDPATVLRAVDGIDVVFHNVAQVPLAKDPELFETVNVQGTEVLLDACREAGVAKSVHTSSSAIFGPPTRWLRPPRRRRSRPTVRPSSTPRRHACGQPSRAST